MNLILMLPRNRELKRNLKVKEKVGFLNCNTIGNINKAIICKQNKFW